MLYIPHSVRTDPIVKEDLANSFSIHRLTLWYGGYSHFCRAGAKYV